MALERTLSIVKPDGVSRNLIGEVYRRFETAGLRIIAARMMHLSQLEAEGFYAVHRARPFFKDLVSYMTSGPVIVQVLEGENAIAKNRELMGATDPKKAAPGTIRADLALSIEQNVVHGSDARGDRHAGDRVLLRRHPGVPARLSSMSAPTETGRTNLLGLTRPQLEEYIAGLGSKPFRARQLMNWIYKRGEGRIGEMTDLAKDFRAQLAQCAEVRVPRITDLQVSADGTRKWKLEADASQAFEMVYIPEPGRGTLCISSQVGCALDCSFCSTAQQGFNRNLTTAEIVGQVWLAARELEAAVGGGPDEAAQVERAARPPRPWTPR